MQIINVDLIPGKVMPILHASQFDIGRSLGVKLYNGGAVYALAGTEVVSVSVRKPDGNIVTEALTNAGGSLVEIITTEQMTACAGCSLCEIKIEDTGDVIGTANFVLDVEEDPTNGGIASQSEINNLATQVADLVSEQYDSANVIFDAVPTAGHGNGYTVTSEGIKDALDAINNPAASAVSYDNTASGLAATNVQDALDEVVDVFNDNFADAYDPTATYDTGDVCIYNNVLYICTAPTTGTFDPSNWTATTIDNVIGNLSTLTTTDKSSLVGAVNEVNKITDITSDYITMASGYTFTSGKVYKQGKHIFGNIVLSGTLQGGNNTDTLGTIKSDYRPSDPINGFCGISNGQWFTNNIGYVYIASSGGLQVATTPTGMNYAKIHLDYVTA